MRRAGDLEAPWTGLFSQSSFAIVIGETCMFAHQFASLPAAEMLLSAGERRGMVMLAEIAIRRALGRR